MAQIELKVDLIGADNLQPVITISKFTNAQKLDPFKESFDRSIRATLSDTEVIRVVVEFRIPPNLIGGGKPMPSFFQDLAPSGALPVRYREISSSAGKLSRNPRFLHIQT